MKTTRLLVSMLLLLGINGYSQIFYPTSGTSAAGVPIQSIESTGFGHQVMGGSTGSTGRSNSGFGHQVLIDNTTGEYNSGFGTKALFENISGSGNSGFGSGALGLNQSGSYNIAVGSTALYGNVTGIGNTAVGQSAGFNIGGSLNTCLGRFAGYWCTTGGNNLFLGASSGAYAVSGSNNVFIGQVTLRNAPKTPLLTGSNSNNIIIIAEGATAIPGMPAKQRILIDSLGNTGIGLGNNVIPKNRLEVKSTTTAGVGASGLRLTNLKSTSTPSFISNGKVLTVDTNGDVVLTTDSGTSGTLNLYNHNDSLTDDRVVTMADHNLTFLTDPAAPNGKGRIYIGATPTFPTTTGDYRLYVEGGILTEKVKVALRSDTTNWADYVFATGYKLMPLHEVESYVKENKHLPGISSSEELAKEGLDLGDMQAKQMEKIEELTLYVIEQNKTLAKQAATLDNQNKEILELKAQMKVLMERK